MKRRIRLALIVLALALAGCSDDATHAPPASTGAEAANTTPAHLADQTLRARIGMVFTDADPWMAGAVLESGTLRVGDRVFLRAKNSSPTPVTIIAIRDDATQTDVIEAAAPQGVFLSFRPDASTSIGEVGPETLLLGDPATALPNSR